MRLAKPHLRCAVHRTNEHGERQYRERWNRAGTLDKATAYELALDIVQRVLETGDVLVQWGVQGGRSQRPTLPLGDEHLEQLPPTDHERGSGPGSWHRARVVALA